MDGGIFVFTFFGLTMRESFLYIGYLFRSHAILLGRFYKTRSFICSSIYSYTLDWSWIDSWVWTRHSDILISQLLMGGKYMMCPVNSISILISSCNKSENIFNMLKKCLVSFNKILNISPKLGDSLKSVWVPAHVLLVLWLYVT